ncbi:MAG TPA: hypothetical protein PKA63_02770 [Oligoflexia bacterium]|nr:hypothetical protein [Oligoflexia bacterium]HMP47576.1 hypothetical protein [Oligoflexia bacterium]
MKSQLNEIFFLLVAVIFSFSDNIYAEEQISLLSVKELSDQGKHLDAIIALNNDEMSRPLGDILSAARSAWALGLIKEARLRWDEALGHPDCSGVERARALLSRAIMELQEFNFEEARAFGEEGSSLIGASDLRGQLNYVLGEALFAQGLYSLSEGYYERSAIEATKDTRQEALIKLATVQEKLGRASDARKTLVKVELSSSLTPVALKRLISIDSDSGNSAGVRTWIEEGRTAFPSEFHTTRISYGNARAMLQDGLIEEAEEEISRLSKDARENDTWLQLGRALIEEYHAKNILPSGE